MRIKKMPYRLRRQIASFNIMKLRQPFTRCEYVYNYRTGYPYRGEFIQDGYTMKDLSRLRKVCHHPYFFECACAQPTGGLFA